MKYDTDAVIIAAGITTVIVFSLTIFAFQVGKIVSGYNGHLDLWIFNVFFCSEYFPVFFKSFLCPADEGGFHDDGRNAALRPCRLHALWARCYLSPSKQVFQILTWKILSKINQDSSHGVGSSWGSNLLGLLGVWHSGFYLNTLQASTIFIFRWWSGGTTSTRSLQRNTSLQPLPSTWTSSTSSCTSSGHHHSNDAFQKIAAHYILHISRFVGAARSN